MNNNFGRDDLLGKNPFRKRQDLSGSETKKADRSMQSDVNELFILKGDSL